MFIPGFRGAHFYTYFKAKTNAVFYYSYKLSALQIRIFSVGVVGILFVRLDRNKLKQIPDLLFASMPELQRLVQEFCIPCHCDAVSYSRTPEIGNIDSEPLGYENVTEWYIVTIVNIFTKSFEDATAMATT
ncbi:hypothetical protein ACF0H5_009157 [Mactra antiquata]